MQNYYNTIYNLFNRGYIKQQQYVLPMSPKQPQLPQLQPHFLQVNQSPIQYPQYSTPVTQFQSQQQFNNANLQSSQDKVKKFLDATKKFEDFLDSCEEVSPEYQMALMLECYNIMIKKSRKNNHQ